MKFQVEEVLPGLVTIKTGFGRDVASAVVGQDNTVQAVFTKPMADRIIAALQLLEMFESSVGFVNEMKENGIAKES